MREGRLQSAERAVPTLSKTRIYELLSARRERTPGTEGGLHARNTTARPSQPGSVSEASEGSPGALPGRRYRRVVARHAASSAVQDSRFDPRPPPALGCAVGHRARARLRELAEVRHSPALDGRA